MKRWAILALIVATSAGATAGPPVAVVRVKEIYAALPATEDLQKRVKQERDAILQDPRAGELRRIIGELQAIQAMLSDKQDPPSADAAQRLVRQYEFTRQEAQALQRDFETFRAEREKDINRRMVASMRASLALIHEAAIKVAAEQGCGMVLDNSGNTNTGLPLLLYEKNLPDLTDAVVKAIEEREEKSAILSVNP
jgi:outer membrane protein